MRTGHRKKASAQGGRVGLAHGNAWRAMEWYVPFCHDRAIIYHGHEDADDHSLCGPQIYCCPKAALLHLQAFPEAADDNTEWQFTHGRHLASWLGRDGPKFYYFYFCDPDNFKIIRFVGVTVPGVQDVLLKRTPLDRYLREADRICGTEL